MMNVRRLMIQQQGGGYLKNKIIWSKKLSIYIDNINFVTVYSVWFICHFEWGSAKEFKRMWISFLGMCEAIARLG